MRKTLILSLLICIAVNANSQNKYDATRINSDLLKNANAVIRADDTDFEVKAAGKATEKTLYAITILNKKADGLSNFYAVYDKFTNVTQLKATVFDGKGEKIKSFNKSDFTDRSLISDFSIYEDNRFKSLSILETSYPYTVEFSAVKEFSGILTYPQWSTLSSFNISLESSSYRISIPENLSLRFKESPLTKVTHKTADGRKHYSWHADNIKAFKSEALSAGIRKLVPWAVLAPNEFDFDNSTGNLSTWDSLGDWINQLNKDGDQLTEPTIATVNKLVNGISDPRKKIEVLYNHLQNTTRYVSVQLGIGGFKPVNAAKVSQVNYGDCKALSNYMKALLKSAGIASELVLIKSEESIDGSLYEDFSSIGQANHMILCVPTLKDTVWLECTSQRMPFGYLGSSNSNRKVLLVTKDGGKITRTPVYSTNSNKQNRLSNVAISATGISSANVTTEYEFEQFDNISSQLYREPKEQKDYLYNSLDIANTDIISYSYKQPDKNRPRLVEKVDLNINDLTSMGGDKLFLTLNLMNKRSYVPETAVERLTDFVLQMNYTDIDQVNYDLPAGYKVDFLPKDVKITSDFGEYSVKTSVSGNKIIYTRTQKMNSKRYPAARFQELVDFYKNIYKADKLKAVLSKI